MYAAGTYYPQQSPSVIHTPHTAVVVTILVVSTIILVMIQQQPAVPAAPTTLNC
jgi:hypothetical protein